VINQSLKQIPFNVLGGIVAGVITLVIVAIGKKVFFLWNRRKFRQVFGEDILKGTGFHLVYAQFALTTVMDEHGNVLTHPYIKPGEEISGVGFSIDRPVSSCEVRAAKYLAEIIGAESKNAPVLSSDYELKGRLDISFVSFGGPRSNYKTRDAIGNNGNQLIIFDNVSFQSKRSRKPVLQPEQGFDYGLILKIHPTRFPERIWLVCAGLGEWGTSGAAWYLSHKWREIYDYAKQKSFAIIVRVRPNQDESAEPIIKVKNSTEAEQYANMVENRTRGGAQNVEC
jgi:hypothetical protein